MITSVIVSIMVGSLIWLDRVFVFQSMISRPIVLSTVLGLVLGNVHAGLLIGASLELLWLNAPPVGAYLPNDDSFCAIVATPAAVLACSSMSEPSAVGFALVLSLPFSLLGRAVDMHIRTVNQELLPDNMENIENKILFVMKKALARSYLYALLSIGTSTVLLCTVVYMLMNILPGFLISAFSYMPFISIIIGLAGLVSKDMPGLSQTGVFVLGMAVVLIMTWII
ncbi:MAG: PTS sugar transporter subunit IIC [Deltaproteobacteria bacterium]|nr:PTS sugar transporter subunit IIC [Deltaproteobacteria bacterium]